MKKIFFCTAFLFIATFFISAQCGASGLYSTVASMTSNTCGVRFSFLGLTSHTGSITTTTTYINNLTGDTCEVSSSTGCGAGGGSFDWWWE